MSWTYSRITIKLPVWPSRMCQAQEADPVLSLVISRLRDGTLGKGQSKATDPFKVSQLGQEQKHLVLKKGILYRQARPRESEETLLQLVLPTAYREVALRGCHDEVSHLGLQHMLDLMHDRFFWPCMAAQAKEHVGKCCLCLAFKARQQKAPPWKYCGHSSSIADPPQLLVSGAWEGPGRKCSGDYRPFHQVCPGLCHKDPDCPNDC